MPWRKESEDSMTQNDPPNLQSLLVNHEKRLNLIEYDVGKLQDRMPMNKFGQAVWWIVSLWMLAVPIIGGYAVLFMEDPWKTMIAAGAFGLFAGRNVIGFVKSASHGPRPHRSVLVEDHR